MKTPMQEALEIALAAACGNQSEQDVKDLFEALLSSEQEEIEMAWMDGNEKGWKMETDWPESATEYFNNRFKSKK